MKPLQFSAIYSLFDRFPKPFNFPLFFWGFEILFLRLFIHLLLLCFVNLESSSGLLRPVAVEIHVQLQSMDPSLTQPNPPVEEEQHEDDWGMILNLFNCGFQSLDFDHDLIVC